MKQPKSLILVAAAIAAAVTGAPAHAADPTTADCLSANDASISLRNQHKLREARTQLLLCAAATCPADIRNECTRRVTELNAAMPTIVFEAKNQAGDDLSAVKVTLDGQLVANKLEGTALSIDPGEHTFTFETAGQPVVEKSFVIREGEKDRRERIQFGTRVAAVVGTGTAATAGTDGKARGTTTILVGDSGERGRKTVGWVLGGVGLAGLIAGGVVLGLGFTEKSQSDQDPPGSKRDSDYNAAIEDQTIGYIVGGVGIASLATGVVLLVTSGGAKAPDSDAPKASAGLRFVPVVASGRTGFGLAGTF
jgi:hypothetical protein